VCCAARTVPLLRARGGVRIRGIYPEMLNERLGLDSSIESRAAQFSRQITPTSNRFPHSQLVGIRGTDGPLRGLRSLPCKPRPRRWVLVTLRRGMVPKHRVATYLERCIHGVAKPFQAGYCRRAQCAPQSAYPRGQALKLVAIHEHGETILALA